MSANVEVIEKERKGVMLIPVKAIHRDQGRTYVNVRKKPGDPIEKRIVEIGLSDERNVEVASGLTADDIVIMQARTYSAQKKTFGTNPFLPFGREKKK
jgi:multidrug efflux pump subunit AcrA (membrane-fusion protein)